MPAHRRRIIVGTVLTAYLLFGVWAFGMSRDRMFGLALFSAVSVVLWLLLRVLAPRPHNNSYEKKNTE